MNAQEFWQHYQRDPETGCLNWTGAKNPVDGYGQVRFGPKGKVQRAHIVAYELVTGEDVPKGIVLEHKCDNRLCGEVTHLSPQTQQHNLTDMAKKGRGVDPGESGTRGVRFTGSGWEARIKMGGELKHLGTFKSEKRAAEAYELAAQQRG